MRVVIINGYPESGKDTFASMCGEFVPVKQLWTSTPAKEALKLLGWGGEEKTPRVRDILANMKKTSVEEFDGVFLYIKEQIETLSDKKGVVFVHSREPQEIHRFKSEFKALTVFIDRFPPANMNHISNSSDKNVINYDYDIYINNRGSLDKLRTWAEAFARLVTDTRN